ncbi:MAG TPA: metal-dependent transcriptional regulator [Caldilineae bacterium]|nr:metal-dependent transcriptional regulator [Caldilineae bacterium]
MTESTEMYLLRIALLSENGAPVPISQLAEELDISPVSTNQMCKKLKEKDLVDYQPYKGVTLTLQGEVIALRVLRKRRLWEVFMVEKLGADPEKAEEVACRFEHVTPDALAERLAEFLGNPTFSPQRQPIPPGLGNARQHSLRPLSALATGKRGQVANIVAADALREFLRSQGVTPGATVKVVAIARNGSILIETNGQHISLSPEIAASIDVTEMQDASPIIHATPTELH